jgi:hypothetical protein
MAPLLRDILGPEVIHYILVLVHAVSPVVEVYLPSGLRCSVVLLSYDCTSPLHEVALGASLLRELVLACLVSTLKLRGNCRLGLHLYLLLNITK